MSVRELINQAERLLRSNSQAILTGTGIAGLVGTAYLTGKATWKMCDDWHHEGDVPKKDLARKYWKLYIAPVVIGAASVGCIIYAAKIGSRRTAALTAAYSLSERAFLEYKDKVIETIGERKEQKVRDDIAQDKVRANPPSGALLLEGTDGVLCCELFTGRYFKSTVETLRKAQNELNARLLNHSYATMSDWYHLIGQKNTTESDNIGWMDQRLMELEFSTVFGPNDIPCLAFEYNYTRPL